MAAAPGHPFLATVVEMVVNHARKRFTVVDYDHLFCPNPQSSIVHAYDILFTTGPCVLGAAVNQVLGRLAHTHIDEGELFIPKEHVVNATIPGRIIILSSNKTDVSDGLRIVLRSLSDHAVALIHDLCVSLSFFLSWVLSISHFGIRAWLSPALTFHIPMIAAIQTRRITVQYITSAVFTELRNSTKTKNEIMKK